MELTKISAYKTIAAEYYDPVKHPTCADFRDATETLLNEFLQTRKRPLHPALEVGAGKSLVAEALQARGLPIAGLLLTDAEPAMLAYSNMWLAQGAELISSSVEDLELAAGAYQSIFACLGDPFNDRLLWRKVANWLAPQGVCFFSTPAYEWIAHYRPFFQSNRIDLAEFLVNSEKLSVPSMVLPAAEQRALVESAGLRVSQIISFTKAAFQGRARSPKINLPHIGPDTPIVTAYIVERS